MEYEKTEDAVRYQKACENVKKIAEVMKIIKIKYYPNFSEISKEDEERYNTLSQEMEKITEENELDVLSKPLMAEISAKYDGHDLEDEKEKVENPETRNEAFEKILLACQGAIDAGAKAVAGKDFIKAQKCKEKLNEYIEMFTQKYDESKLFMQRVIEYQRGVFFELGQKKEMVKNSVQSKMEFCKQCCEKNTAQDRKEAMENFPKERTQKRIIEPLARMERE